MNVLSIKNLCKKYEKFELRDVSFEIEAGTITGFIGRNGAGKTTTLKSLLNFVHPDGGDIRFFGESFADRELDIKTRIGFVSGGVSYYPKKKIKTITAVNKQFYQKWDEQAYRRYLEMFNLDESKTPEQLSEGMKVKYSLSLALSHHAELLILDEPTSGLDPVSRDDLLDVFLELVRNEGVSILFSTHITSDLEKCADNIVYIKKGQIIESDSLDNFLAKYQTVEIPEDDYREGEFELIGVKHDRKTYSAIQRSGASAPSSAIIKPADLETIMIHMEKE